MQCPVNYSFNMAYWLWRQKHRFFLSKVALIVRSWELVFTPGVQRSEDARNLTSLRARRRSPGDLEQPPGNRRRKFSIAPFCETAERQTFAEKNVEVCDVARA
jgi:hypothetical protein